MIYNKIHIIGPAGSGKTTISKKLSTTHGIPHLNMDNIFWDKTARRIGTKNSKNDRDNKLHAFIVKDRYIVEGSYYKWGFESWKNADIIIFLTPPFRTTLHRLIKRFIKRLLNIDKEKRGSVINFIKMVHWNYKWYKRIPEFITRAKTYNGNVVRVYSTDELLDVLRIKAKYL